MRLLVKWGCSRTTTQDNMDKLGSSTALLTSTQHPTSFITPDFKNPSRGLGIHCENKKEDGPWPTEVIIHYYAWEPLTWLICNIFNYISGCHCSSLLEKRKESRCSEKKIKRKHKGLDGKDRYHIQESEISHRFPDSNDALIIFINTTYYSST